MNDFNLEEVKETKENNHEAELVNNKFSNALMNGPKSNQDDQLLTVGKAKKKRIKISICGHTFITFEDTLRKCPNSRLCTMLDPQNREHPKKGADAYYPETDEYYFDRHLPSFPAILYYLQMYNNECPIPFGPIWRPLDVPMEIFVEEVIYYNLADDVLRGDIGDEKPKEQCCRPNERTVCIKSRELVWNSFERPEKSIIAKGINIASIFFIILSTVSFCLETIPTFHTDNCYNKTIQTSNGLEVRSYERLDYDPESKTFGFWVIETLCIMFFTVEFCLRFWSSPDRLQFARGFMNLIDLAAILPYYITLIFQTTITDDNIGLCTDGPLAAATQNTTASADGVPESNSSASVQDKATFLMVLRVIRLARIVRIAKLSRHSRNLNTLIKTMQTSLRELSFLMLFFIVSMILFSTFIYFCEVNDNGAMFPSIPSAFWWAIVTMTTVGYGDLYPKTPLGKVVGFFCAICGVLCIALPVPSIVSNFHRLYQEDQIMNPHGNNEYKDDAEETRCKLRKKFLSDV